MSFLSFDIEISDVFDLKPGEEMEKYAPFHLAVASTVVHGGESHVWYSVDGEGHPLANMTRNESRGLLAYLDQAQQNGTMVCAWNGLGFDLRWIGHTARNMALAAKIALKSYDPMFQFFNQRGFPVGLAAVAKGMGVKQEKIMHGADAPREWQAGNYEKVMDYVLGDSQMTNAIIFAIQERKQVQWVTRRGTISSEPIPQLKTVQQVIAEPFIADQSWMSNPIPKRKFCGWALEAKGKALG